MLPELDIRLFAIIFSLLMESLLLTGSYILKRLSVPFTKSDAELVTLDTLIPPGFPLVNSSEEIEISIVNLQKVFALWSCSTRFGSLVRNCVTNDLYDLLFFSL